MSTARKIAVITGPTATGKTRLGILLAEKLNGEIVSADSMQIYRRMDIGTAKPTAAERRLVPHHMIDIAEPGEKRSVAQYAEEASDCVDDILKRGRLPIVVGGTGFYIDALISGRSFAASDEDGLCRQELSGRYDEIGGAALLKELSQIDPIRAAQLKAADKKRIVRAYEIWLLTGKTATEHGEEMKRQGPAYDAAIIALNYGSRKRLYERIDERVDEMMASGLEAEVGALLNEGISPNSTALQAIGYKELLESILGEVPVSEAVNNIKQGSRRYAKRQLTWLRGKEDIHWLTWGDEPDFEAGLRDSLEFLGTRGIC